MTEAEKIKSLVNAIQWRDNPEYWSTEELVMVWRDLHTNFGDKPNAVAEELEQKISIAASQRGLPNRYKDKLSKDAGTQLTDIPAPTIREVMAYLDPIALDSRAVNLVQSTDQGPVYVEVRASLLQPLVQEIIRAVNRFMPPGVTVLRLPNAKKGTFVETASVYSLALQKTYGWSEVSTWDAVVKDVRGQAQDASRVFKQYDPLALPLTVVKVSEDDKRIITACILRPGVVDKTVANPDGSATGAAGDVYDEGEVWKAMCWYMEHCRDVGVHHSVDGGYAVTDDDIVLLENWQERQGWKTDRGEIKLGDWMQTHKVHNDKIWADIKAGKLTGWSVGMNMQYRIEEIAQEE
ncbi:MAG: hypothetical protein FJ098_04590 [Deltaproteobacteria bacterium]|nr:hypothetical protein [Deltaproteobacteria bacterium]